jgi:hypothetical protein
MGPRKHLIKPLPAPIFNDFLNFSAVSRISAFFPNTPETWNFPKLWGFKESVSPKK